ncbi:MAG: hypothetical protein EOS40_23145 [Mesorhizobium sp.]|nr:hypothetical protein EJ071_05935 [Mesorhizobium sp. M1B.F.Ca.ET.045.04.1.1]RWB18609.1 MAG: hypothetical protein EOQ40_24055 [Mesorhizobium sp.]RWD98635.1 MAG: hypothetical protein EOS40_23145 [Mesorhizobium sp.]
MARLTRRGAPHLFSVFSRKTESSMSAPPQSASFLSLRRGERWLGEAETEWGNHLATAANGRTKGTRRKHRLALRPRGRPPLRRASLDTSPPIDGGEEGPSSAAAVEDGQAGEGRRRRQ